MARAFSIRQSTEAESKLSTIYDLPYITPKPWEKKNHATPKPEFKKYGYWKSSS